MDKINSTQLQSLLEDLLTYLMDQNKKLTETYENNTRPLLIERLQKTLDILNSANKIPSEDLYLHMNATNLKKPVPSPSAEDKQEDEYIECSSPINVDSEPEKQTPSLVILPNIEKDDDLTACPYSGLPVAHLTIKNTIKTGYLNRVEKKMFFEQNRKYYCGLLGRWLLMYQNNVGDLKPTFYIYISRNVSFTTGLDTISKKKSTEGCFQIILNKSNAKKFYFQAPSHAEMIEWVRVLTTAQESLDLSLLPLCHLRRLPTPPPQSSSTTVGRNALAIDPEKRSSQKSDSIYEEPVSLLENNIIVSNNKMICFLNGCRIEYDIPKNIPISINHAPSQTILIDDQMYEPVAITPSPTPTPIPPKLKPSSRSWLNRLTSSGGGKPVTPSPPTSPDRTKTSPTTTSPSTKGLKGQKVNMIINQLEANGHLPLISKQLHERRSFALMERDEEYDSVG